MPFLHGYVLTGAIATGKSTVCSLLRIYGFCVVDADVIAREEIENCKEELRDTFGDSIFDAQSINRAKLASMIFESTQDREKLNAILHPKIKAKIEKIAQDLDKKCAPYILDIPLYFETKNYKAKMAVVVYAPKEIQLQRLMQRDSLSIYEAQKRIDSQMSIEEKREMADFIIDNSRDLKHLQKEVEKFVEYVRGQYANS